MSFWKPFIFGEYYFAVVAGEQGIEQLSFTGTPAASVMRDDAFPLLREADAQLHAYFAGELKVFHLPLAMQGTPFQQRVWKALLEIPYGETRSYLQIAKVLDASKAVRAVGAANGQNPIPIVVPCHRVIGSSGKLTGFGGGLPLKRILLNLEAPQRRL